MTQKAQELFEKFLKEYCDKGYMYSGMLPYDIQYKDEYKELEKLGLIQKRHCDGLAYELTGIEKRKLITDCNLEKLWEKKADYFMENEKSSELKDKEDDYDR